MNRNKIILSQKLLILKCNLIPVPRVKYFNKQDTTVETKKAFYLENSL